LATHQCVVVVGNSHNDVRNDVEYQGKHIVLGSAIHIREFGVNMQQGSLQSVQDDWPQTDEAVGFKKTSNVLVEGESHASFKVDGPGKEDKTRASRRSVSC